MADSDDDLTEEWDMAIARGIMRATWAYAIGSVLTGALALCTGNPCFAFSFLSVGGALNTALRLWGMRPEFRAQVQQGEILAMLLVAAFGGALGLLQPLVVGLYLAFLQMGAA